MTVAQQEFEDDESVRVMDVVFEVEDCIFKVPRRYFEDSELFRNIFQLPIGENAIPDGSSKDHPFRLEGISKDDFRQLLRFMDPRQFRAEIPFSHQQYTAVLKLSTMWEFKEIRELVIQNISALPIDVVDKIVIAKNYHVSQWLLPSLIEYAQRGESITAEDVDRLGLDYFVKIVRVRESIVHSHNIGCFRNPRHLPQTVKYTNADARQNFDFTEALGSAFQDEIKRMQNFINDSAGSEGLRGTTRHAGEIECADADGDRFYFVDVNFLIENCFFKGHRQYFEDSPIFREMFRLPAENGLADGCSKEQPLRIDGVRKADFKQLLKFMDARWAHEKTFSIREWTSILKLSTMWEFEKIRQCAVTEMSKLPIDAVDEIALARDYHVLQGLLPALNKYARRGKSVTVEDVNRLGLEYMLKIIKARESFSGSVRIACSTPGCSSLASQATQPEFLSRQRCDFTASLRAMFKHEIGATRRKTWTIRKISAAPSVLITVEERPHLPLSTWIRKVVGRFKLFIMSVIRWVFKPVRYKIW